MAEPILEAREVSFKFADGTWALKNISLTIDKGMKVAFVGPNGAGKTTLFLHFNGILRPSRGKIRFSGKELGYDHHSLLELRRHVGIVFQDPDIQLFCASVFQEVSFGPLNMGLTDDQVRQRVARAMSAAGITELKNRPTHFLSYGQKKRVSIADILAMDPPVIIFDEPTACLDPKLALEVMDLLEILNQQGKTVIMSTHNVDLAYSWADCIFVVKDGAVAGKGLPEDVFRDDGLLLNCDLKKPWLVDVYNVLREKGLLLEDMSLPRNRDQLFKNIKNFKASCLSPPEKRGD